MKQSWVDSVNQAIVAVMSGKEQVVGSDGVVRVSSAELKNLTSEVANKAIELRGLHDKKGTTLNAEKLSIELGHAIDQMLNTTSKDTNLFDGKTISELRGLELDAQIPLSKELITGIKEFTDSYELTNLNHNDLVTALGDVFNQARTIDLKNPIVTKTQMKNLTAIDKSFGASDGIKRLANVIANQRWRLTKEALTDLVAIEKIAESDAQLMAYLNKNETLAFANEVYKDALREDMRTFRNKLVTIRALVDSADGSSVYFPVEVIGSNRAMFASDVNPQNNKIIRTLFDLSSTNDHHTNNKAQIESSHPFKSPAYWKDVRKQASNYFTTKAEFTEANNFVSAKRLVLTMLDVKVEKLNDVEVHKAFEDVTKEIHGKDGTLTGEQLTQARIMRASGMEGFVSLRGMRDMDAIIDAIATGKSEVSIKGETDGINNGIALTYGFAGIFDNQGLGFQVKDGRIPTDAADFSNTGLEILKDMHAKGDVPGEIAKAFVEAAGRGDVKFLFLGENYGASQSGTVYALASDVYEMLIKNWGDKQHGVASTTRGYMDKLFRTLRSDDLVKIEQAHTDYVNAVRNFENQKASRNATAQSSRDYETQRQAVSDAKSKLDTALETLEKDGWNDGVNVNDFATG